jgi:hypothetical protein
MKKIKILISMVLVSIVLILATELNAQEKYFTRDATISFFSTTPVEDIKAINSKVSCVLDSETGKIEFAVLMKAFVFKKALMEEHFNENYVESSKYPKATFKGQIENLDEIDFLKDGNYPTSIKGTMNIHGESKEITASGTIEVKNGNILLSSDFNLLPEDFAIEIPGVVRDKIAKQLLISLNAQLAPFNR